MNTFQSTMIIVIIAVLIIATIEVIKEYQENNK